MTILRRLLVHSTTSFTAVRPLATSSRFMSSSIVTVPEAADVIRQGGVVAFPTETVYGLAADARSDDAVLKIFSTKGRPQDNPLIVHIGDRKQLKDFVQTDKISPAAKILMDKFVHLPLRMATALIETRRFWPGPLTLVLPVVPNKLSSKTTAGLGTVGVRMVDHPVGAEFLRLCDAPLAAPSANPSGRPSPTCAQHVIDDYNGTVPVVDGGPCHVGLESTIVDCSLDDEQVYLLRPGGVPCEEIELFCRVVQPSDHSESSSAPKAPGMKYTHYAPNAPVNLVIGSRDFLQKLVRQKQAEGCRVGVLTSPDNAVECDVLLTAGSADKNDLPSLARGLYGALRDFDRAKVQHIFVTAVSSDRLGLAIMNRLAKASGHQVIAET